MEKLRQFVFIVSIISAVLCSPFDDGKYRPRTYDEFDDGKYYRPLDEGKYVPGDEGRYTYVYKQGVWPFDGTYKYERIDKDDPYMGYQVYASRYPYIHGVIKGLVSKYVSSDNINFGEATEGSNNHYSKVYADKEVAVKCKYIMPESNGSEFTTQYPPHMNLKSGEKLGSFYSFKGSKVLSTVSNALTNKMKLEYEVFVRVVEDISSPPEPVPTAPAKEEVTSPLIILRPSTYANVESSTNNEVKKSVSEILKSLIIKDVLPTVGGIEPSTAENLKLTIDDVQLVPSDELGPTLSYEQILDDDEIKASTANFDSTDIFIENNIIPSNDEVQVFTEDNSNVTSSESLTTTEAGKR